MTNKEHEFHREPSIPENVFVLTKLHNLTSVLHWEPLMWTLYPCSIPLTSAGLHKSTGFNASKAASPIRVFVGKRAKQQVWYVWLGVKPLMESLVKSSLKWIQVGLGRSICAWTECCIEHCKRRETKWVTALYPTVRGQPVELCRLNSRPNFI